MEKSTFMSLEKRLLGEQKNFFELFRTFAAMNMVTFIPQNIVVWYVEINSGAIKKI